MPLVTRTTTAGNIIVQDAEPSNKTNGTLWVDTGDSPPTVNVADGTSYKMPGFKINGTKAVKGEALV